MNDNNYHNNNTILTSIRLDSLYKWCSTHHYDDIANAIILSWMNVFVMNFHFYGFWGKKIKRLSALNGINPRKVPFTLCWIQIKKDWCRDGRFLVVPVIAAARDAIFWHRLVWASPHPEMIGAWCWCGHRFLVTCSATKPELVLRDTWRYPFKDWRCPPSALTRLLSMFWLVDHSPPRGLPSKEKKNPGSVFVSVSFNLSNNWTVTVTMCFRVRL